MHLDGEGTRERLALALLAGVCTQTGKILFADALCEHSFYVGACIVHDEFQVHLCLASQPLYIGGEVAMIGSHSTTKGVVVLKCCSKTEGKNGGVFEALRDNASMVLLSLLVHAGVVFEGLFRDYDC